MENRKSLSVVMIAKNEAALLPDCLQSVNWADEVIVLDSGSQDDTAAIAESLGAKVFINRNWQGFGKQRQLAQSYASCDYVLMIDADERVTPELRRAIEQVLNAADDDQIYSLGRRNLFLGRFMRHSGWYPDRVNRLYARERYRYNDDLVHESLDTHGARIVPLQGDLLHLTCRDFFTFQRKQLHYAQEWANQRHAAGKRCGYLSILTHTLGASARPGCCAPAFLTVNRGCC